MADYRIYCLDAEGRINLADWFVAENDDEAILHAGRVHPAALKCGIWQGNRLVAKINSTGLLQRP